MFGFGPVYSLAHDTTKTTKTHTTDNKQQATAIGHTTYKDILLLHHTIYIQSQINHT